MKASLLQENLEAGLSIATRAVASRAIQPVLEHVLLEAQPEASRLRLSATDLSIGINVYVGAQIDEEGAICVPAKTLSDLVREFPHDRVDLETDDKRRVLNLRCGRSKANVRGLDPQEMPIVARLDGPVVSLPSADLRQAIAQVAFAAAADESRPILTGCLMRFEAGNLTMAAADGYRLAVKTLSLGDSIDLPSNVIVPARTLAELRRISRDDGNIIITTTDNRIAFEIEDAMLASQLIDGNFPDYRQIIPGECKTRAALDAGDLLRALRQTQVFARDAAQIGRFAVDSDRVTVSGASDEAGDTAAPLDAEVEGDAIEIAFNVEYMLDVVAALDAKRVVLEMTTPSSPGLVRGLGDDSYTYVIMPMHLGR